MVHRNCDSQQQSPCQWLLYMRPGCCALGHIRRRKFHGKGWVWYPSLCTCLAGHHRWYWSNLPELQYYMQLNNPYHSQPGTSTIEGAPTALPRTPPKKSLIDMGLWIDARQKAMDESINCSPKSPSDQLKISAIAGQDIPVGVLSPKITPNTPLDVSTVFWQDSDVDYVVEVTIRDDKMMSSALDRNWMKHVRLSRHCHMQNLQVIAHGDDLYMQSTRIIHKGETLFAWFTMETSKVFKIPFLTLKNIKGGLQYSCHECAKVFEDPNPLKIHLAFLCPSSLGRIAERPVRSSKASDNSRIEHCLKAARGVQSQEPSTKCHRTSSPSSSAGSRSIFSAHSAFKPLRHPKCSTPSSSSSQLTVPPGPSSPPTTIPSFSLSPTGIRPSLSDSKGDSNGKGPAFGSCPTKFPTNCKVPPLSRFQQPVFPGNCLGLSYLQMAMASDRNSVAGHFLGSSPEIGPNSFLFRRPSPETLPDESGASGAILNPDFFLMPNFTNPSHHDLSAKSFVLATTDAPTQEKHDRLGAGIISEELLNSDGRSKRRHKCFYCGKMYSRKYGLKIHIRTHTGYKPLKCKVCLRPFGDPSNLNKHIRLHAEGITPYRCELCGKVLVRRRDLERHMKSRHPCSQEDLSKERQQESTTAIPLKDNNNETKK